MRPPIIGKTATGECESGHEQEKVNPPGGIERERILGGRVVFGFVRSLPARISGERK
jgi:hypothetical protein